MTFVFEDLKGSVVFLVWEKMVLYEDLKSIRGYELFWAHNLLRDTLFGMCVYDYIVSVCDVLRLAGRTLVLYVQFSHGVVTSFQQYRLLSIAPRKRFA